MIQITFKKHKFLTHQFRTHIQIPIPFDSLEIILMRSTLDKGLTPPAAIGEKQSSPAQRCDKIYILNWPQVFLNQILLEVWRLRPLKA